MAVTRRKLNFSQQFLTNTGERILRAEVLALHPEVAGAADGDLEESGWRIIIL